MESFIFAAVKNTLFLKVKKDFYCYCVFYIYYKKQKKTQSKKLCILSSHYIFFSKLTKFCISPAGYPRGQSSSVSPRAGYGSNGSTPHSSNGSSYSNTSLNGYHGSTGSLGNMGMIALSSFYNYY